MSVTEPASDADRFEFGDTRPIFATAARSLTAVVRRIEPDQWDRPALGEWTVRSLVGHALRGVTTAPMYLATPADEISLHSVRQYLRAARSMPDLHRGVADRGHAAGTELGDDPLAVVDAAVEDSVEVITATSLDATLTLPFATMRLGDYLPTRIIEVTVHTDDLCRALELDHVASPEEAKLVLEAMITTAGTGDGLSMIRAVLGREALPDGFNLWG